MSTSQSARVVSEKVVQLTTREAWVWVLILLVVGAIMYNIFKALWQCVVAAIRNPPSAMPQQYAQQPPPQPQNMGHPPGNYGQQNGPIRQRAMAGQQYQQQF